MSCALNSKSRLTAKKEFVGWYPWYNISQIFHRIGIRNIMNIKVDIFLSVYEYSIDNSQDFKYHNVPNMGNYCIWNDPWGWMTHMWRFCSNLWDSPRIQDSSNSPRFVLLRS